MEMFRYFQQKIEVKETFKIKMNQLIEKEFISQIIFSEIGSNQDLNRHLQRVNQLKQTGMIEEGIETKILIPLNSFLFQIWNFS